MFYTPEPPLYIVVECPPFATDEGLAELINEHLPNPDHHIEFAMTRNISLNPGSSVVRYEFEYDDNGVIVEATPIIRQPNFFPGAEPSEIRGTPIRGGRYLIAPCNSLTGVGARWFTDQIDSIDNKPIHPYTDIYVTL